MTKIEKSLFYLFIFLLPVQIGKFLFAFSPLPGSFYHQAFIYLSDILILTLLVFWGVRIIKDAQERQNLCRALKKEFVLILFVILASISVFFAGDKGLSAFRFLKIAEFVLFYFYVRQNFRHIDTKQFSIIVIISAVLQVFVATSQFYLQESIGLRYLGESPLSPIIDGVAKINESGFKLIRAYGTFPHPNILAAFLIFALFLTYYAVFYNGARIRQNTSKYVIQIFALFLLSLGLMLAFSRSALASFLLVSGTFFIFLILFGKKMIIDKVDKAKAIKIFVIMILIFGFLGFIFQDEIIFRVTDISGDQSLSQRIIFTDIAKEQIFSSPIFGIGVGNFVTEFYSRNPGLSSWQYQPAHNLFLLVAAEVGVLAALLLAIFIFQNLYWAVKNRIIFENIFALSIFIIFINYLILANFDHYFWTLQQGQILFWLILGMLNPVIIRQYNTQSVNYQDAAWDLM